MLAQKKRKSNEKFSKCLIRVCPAVPAGARSSLEASIAPKQRVYSGLRHHARSSTSPFLLSQWSTLLCSPQIRTNPHPLEISRIIPDIAACAPNPCSALLGEKMRVTKQRPASRRKTLVTMPWPRSYQYTVPQAKKSSYRCVTN